MSRIRDIANSNGGFKKGVSASRPSPATVGDLYFNTANNALEVYLSTRSEEHTSELQSH